MPKKKKFVPKPKGVQEDDAEEWPEGFSGDDSEDESTLFGRSEVDKFHRNKEKELLKKSSLVKNDDWDEDSNDEEGIMDIGDDSDEDEEMDDDGQEAKGQSDADDSDDGDGLENNFYRIQAKKLDMESDLESNADDDEEAGLPDSKAWGKNKKQYYSTDYIDQGFKKVRMEEQDIAKAEEQEALAIQKRLIAEMNNADLDIDWITGKAEEGKGDDDDDEESASGDDEQVKIPSDLSALSSKERMAILRKDSPELFPLVEDFKIYMSEAKEKLEPLMNLAKNPKFAAIQRTSGYHLLEVKYHLILRYCANISFYMVLKCKRIMVKNHPIIKTLLNYKRLIAKVDALQQQEDSSSVNSDMDFIFGKLAKGQDFIVSSESERKTLDDKQTSTTSLSSSSKKKRKNTAEATAGEPATKVDLLTSRLLQLADGSLQVASSSPDQQLKPPPNFAVADGGVVRPEAVDEEEGGKEEDDGDEDVRERRGITYQIAKNKGLTAQKKKELRNPRVKHRLKYKKAQVRRKGQVRQPRKELTKYGGELSGIKAGLVRSIKFKH